MATIPKIQTYNLSQGLKMIEIYFPVPLTVVPKVTMVAGLTLGSRQLLDLQVGGRWRHYSGLHRKYQELSRDMQLPDINKRWIKTKLKHDRMNFYGAHRNIS